MKRKKVIETTVLTLRVFSAAMEWHDRNVVMGMERGNFLGQSRKLFDACANLRKLEQQIED